MAINGQGCDFKFLPSATLTDDKFFVSDDSERYELTFQFLGEKHIKLTFSKKVLRVCEEIHKRAPEVVEWVGVSETWEEREEKRKAQMELVAKRRARSLSDGW